MAYPLWTIDGKVLPRNPDSYDFKYDAANVSYEPQGGGNLIRVSAPQLISGSTLTLTWMDADRRTLNTIMRAFNPLALGVVHNLKLAGIQPDQQANVFFDTPQKTMSKEVYDTRPGQGGTRNDLTLTCRTIDPYLRSVNNVPVIAPTPAQMIGLFGGPAQNGIDGIPVWNAVPYNTGLTGTGTASPSISNLGTAPWSPVIKFNGPFTALTMKQTYFDVDSTGAGTKFVWTGAAVSIGNYVLFDTATKRCYLVIGGAVNEVYTFAVATVAGNIPFSYWPPMNPGNNSVTATMVGFGVGSSMDFSNNGSNQFFYW